MNAAHWNTNAKVTRREIEFVQALFKGANTDAQNEYAETLKKFLSYKEGQLTMMEESGVIHSKIDDLLEKVSDLVVNSGDNNKTNTKIANNLYSSQLFNSTLLHEDAIDELIKSYVSMLTFQSKGDLYFFGAFVYKQIECLVNYFILKINGFDNVRNDLELIVTKPNKKDGPTTKKLGTEIVSSSYSMINFAFTNMSFQTKIKYLNWYFEKKQNGRFETPFLDYNPYHFLNTARKKAFHGWFTPEGEETNRIFLLEDNPGYFFSLFHKLLHDTVAYLFKTKYLVSPKRN